MNECPMPLCGATTYYAGMDNVGRPLCVCPIHGVFAVNGGGRK